MTGLDKIAEERHRQKEMYGYNKEHDEEHDRRELMRFAFAILAFHLHSPPNLDSWYRAQPEWIQENSEAHSENYEDALYTAGALIAAELDRLSEPDDSSDVDTTITKNDIVAIIKAGDLSSWKMGKKTTVLQLRLPNGFEITTTASCVDPDEYDQEQGERVAYSTLKDKVWNHVGFLAHEVDDPVGRLLEGE